MKNRIYLDFAECSETIKDLETIDWVGENINKGDLMRSHLSDALGYLVHSLMPFKVGDIRKVGKQMPKNVAV